MLPIRSSCHNSLSAASPLGIVFFFASLAAMQAPAQQPATAPANSIPVAVQPVPIPAPASPGIKFTGNATWHAGSLADTGTATLTADVTGNALLTLDLASKGHWSEAQSSIGTAMACSWTGADGKVHFGSSLTCARPVVWFFPSLSLQTANIGILTTALANDIDGSKRLQVQLPAPKLPAKLLPVSNILSNRGTAVVVLDATTSLPRKLKYSTVPDNGAPVQIPVEIRYSDYRGVQGTQIPFHIQRYLNGTLQLDIVLNSAQIN